VFYTFITAHPKCIKVWDACDGRLISVFRDLTTNNRDITCICLDKRKRKLFVGDSKGRVFTINIKNGAKMKKFKRHK
jgi:WD40 repeat protein